MSLEDGENCPAKKNIHSSVAPVSKMLHLNLKALGAHGLYGREMHVFNYTVMCLITLETLQKILKVKIISLDPMLNLNEPAAQDSIINKVSLRDMFFSVV